MWKLFLGLSILVCLSLVRPNEDVNDDIGDSQKTSTLQATENIAYDSKKLSRAKRFHFLGLTDSRSGYRICGRNFYGTAIYTNGYRVICHSDNNNDHHSFCDDNSEYFCRN